MMIGSVLSHQRLLAFLSFVILVSASCGPGAEPSATSTITVPTSASVPPTSVTTSVASSSTSTSTTTTSTTTTTAATTTTQAATTTSSPQMGPAVVVTKVDTSEKVVALTFDAGSDRGFATEILDTLAANGIKASFGMTGAWAESNPDLLRRMADEGHALINHTYNHPHMETLSGEERLAQLQKAETVIMDIVGVSTKPYFRPPYGSYNNQVLIDVGSAGYRYSVMWTVDCLGWKGLPASEVVARCRDALQPGAILLMHVGAASTDYSALEDIIAIIDESGYRYATISELLA